MNVTSLPRFKGQGIYTPVFNGRTVRVTLENCLYNTQCCYIMPLSSLATIYIPHIGTSFSKTPLSPPVFLQQQLQIFYLNYNSVFSSVAQLCPTLCHPMNHSTPGLPVHQLPEFTQTHVHQVSDAIQPSHPLPSLSPPAPNPSHHQSLFQ